MTTSPRLCVPFAALLALAPLRAQGDEPATIPPKGWEVLEQQAKPGPGPRPTPRLVRDDDGGYELRFTRAKGWVETVVTDGDGAVLARGDDAALSLPDLDVGDRYAVHVADASRRRCMLVRSDFVRYPGTIVPTKEWKPREDAALALADVEQRAPRTKDEARRVRHEIRFGTTEGERPVVYVLARVVAGGKDMVAAQSLTGALPFWLRAQKGESFRIYALDPGARTYRVSDVMAVESDYPRR